MKIYRCIVPVFFLVICFLSGEATAQKKRKQTIASQNEILFKQLKQEHNLDDSQMKKIRAIFKRSGYMNQGKPSITRHPVSEKACEQKLQKEEISYENPDFEKICGDKYMAPLFDPSSEKQEQANYCIDQFEFPNIPCAYPLIWVRAREASLICEAVGKRLCDAHEWESGCEGRLTPPDYRFDLAAKFDSKGAVKVMRKVHNAKYGKNKTWSYGKKYKKGICAANSKKSSGCSGGNWSRCGSNTYPAGYFSECRSSLEVYDIHGNAAEHMNLPLKESQMSCKGSKELGYTEMKGSWFIFDKYYAHQDWCRWRAPYWHGSRVMAKNSHRNYHLGFRCCKTLKEK